MKRSLILIMFTAIMLLAAVSNLYAGVPSMISYQGRLTDTDGQPVEDGVHSILFKIYDAPTNGAILWSSFGSIPLQITDGLFAHLLGSTNPIPDSLTGYDSLWLGTTVDLDSEIMPRTRLVSVSFAYKALIAEHALTASMSASATFSDTAFLALNSIASDSAGYSDTSSYAIESYHSQQSDYAEDAGHAATSDTADVALNAVRAAVPVGSITAWAKSLANTPSLLDGWAECNGQTLSDPESPYDGQIIPDLNGISGLQMFLRGSSSSGSAGGSETHNHGTHIIYIGDQDWLTSGRDLSSNHLPPYYEIVWIMRIK